MTEERMIDSLSYKAVSEAFYALTEKIIEEEDVTEDEQFNQKTPTEISRFDIPEGTGKFESPDDYTPVVSVDNPSHYKSHPSGVECIKITEHYDFIIGNIIKYAWRAGLKSGETKLDDLKKCLWYANRAVEKESK